MNVTLPAASREYATLTTRANLDPGDATIEVRIDGTWRPMTWVGPAVQKGDLWYRDARILLAGPNAAAGTALVLSAGRHFDCAWRLSTGAEVIVRDAGTIDVV